MAKKQNKRQDDKSLESWIWNAACAIRGAKDAGKFKDYILPLIFVKRLCDVFDDEVNRIAKGGSRTEALKKIASDNSRVRFFIPLKSKDPEAQDTWSVIRSLSSNIGEELTRIIRDIAAHNSILDGVIDTVDYNATTRGQREIDDDRLSNLIEAISQKRLGLNDVEPDIIGRSYEYLIRKFAEGSGQSAGEFYTPREVGIIMAKIMDPEPGMEIYDPTCGSAGLLIKCELELKEKQEKLGKKTFAPLRLYGQEYTTTSWAMAKMNMIIHDMEGDVELGDTFNNPKLKDATGHGIKKFDRVVANPMWNQPGFNEEIYANDVYHRFPAGNPGGKADWGWLQHIYSSLKDKGRAAVVLDTGAASRGSGNENKDKEKEVRKWFVDNDIIETVILLPENVFYNTPNMGLIFILNKNKKKNKGKIIMVDISEYFDRKRPKNLISEQGMSFSIDATVNNKEIDNVSSIVNISLISSQENDYNLLPNRYIRRKISNQWTEKIDNNFTTTAKYFEKLYIYKLLALYFKEQLELNRISDLRLLSEKNNKWIGKSLNTFLKESELRFSDASLENPTILSLSKNSGLISQGERFNQKIAIDDLSKYKVVKKGWLVYNPMVIWEGAIHVLYDHEVGVVSPAYKVWTIEGIDQYYLDFILKNPAILDEYRRLSSGGVNRRRIVSGEDFLSIKIPMPVGNELKKLNELIENKLKQYRKFVNDMN